MCSDKCWANGHEDRRPAILSAQARRPTAYAGPSEKAHVSKEKVCQEKETD